MYINPLSDMICKHLLPFCWLSFCFISGFLCYANVFKCNILIVAFVYFFLVVITWAYRSKKILLGQLLESLLPVLFSWNFMISGLIFKFLIHFEFFCIWSNSGPASSFCMNLSTFPSSIYWKDCSFSIVCSCLF